MNSLVLLVKGIKKNIFGWMRDFIGWVDGGFWDGIPLVLGLKEG